MFRKANGDGYRQLAEGVAVKALVHGEKTMLTEFVLRTGNPVPHHSHPHEQTGYLVSGALRLTIGDETFDVAPGDSWCIPAHVEHAAEVLADSVAVEVFCPPREDYRG